MTGFNLTSFNATSFSLIALWLIGLESVTVEQASQGVTGRQDLKGSGTAKDAAYQQNGGGPQSKPHHTEQQVQR